MNELGGSFGAFKWLIRLGVGYARQSKASVCLLFARKHAAMIAYADICAAIEIVAFNSCGAFPHCPLWRATVLDDPLALIQATFFQVMPEYVDFHGPDCTANGALTTSIPLSASTEELRRDQRKVAAARLYCCSDARSTISIRPQPAFRNSHLATSANSRESYRRRSYFTPSLFWGFGVGAVQPYS